VVNADFVAEAGTEAIGELGGKSDFWNQDEGGFALGKEGRDRLQVYFGFSRTRDAVEEDLTETLAGCDRIQGGGLGGGEDFGAIACHCWAAGGSQYLSGLNDDVTFLC
jgi:hypothetical protein